MGGGSACEMFTIFAEDECQCDGPAAANGQLKYSWNARSEPSWPDGSAKEAIDSPCFKPLLEELLSTRQDL